MSLTQYLSVFGPFHYPRIMLLKSYHYNELLLTPSKSQPLIVPKDYLTKLCVI
jgi:hypothetical protein